MPRRVRHGVLQQRHDGHAAAGSALLLGRVPWRATHPGAGRQLVLAVRLLQARHARASRRCTLHGAGLPRVSSYEFHAEAGVTCGWFCLEMELVRRIVLLPCLFAVAAWALCSTSRHSGAHFPPMQCHRPKKNVLAALPVLVGSCRATERADGGLPLNRCAVAARAVVQVCGCDVGHHVRHHRRAEQDPSHHHRKMPRVRAYCVCRSRAGSSEAGN